MQSEESYKIDKAPIWAESLTDEQIKNLIVDTDFAQEQIDEGRDFCYFLNKYNHINDNSKSDYALMAYTLTQPENLERASVYDMVLEENETFEIHRICVYRDGVLIDKLPDTTVKVLDNENQSNGGVIVKSKKINISIKDLHLYDVLIMEDTRVKIFTEKEFVRRDFVKHTYITPDTYWAYGKYIYKFINDRNQVVAYKKFFFRDENRELIDSDVQYLQKGEVFEFNQTNYINSVDSGREIYPFIDFATESNWKNLSNYLYPFYKDILQQADLKSFAPELVQKIDAFSSIDEKLQYAIEFVQNNIYYTYNAYEMNGHKPQEPSITFQNKQGDCKAKCTLLKVILDYIGVESSIVLVNYNADFYLKYYLPSLLSFNHVIVKISYKGEDYFIDATSRNEFGRLEKRSVLSFCHFMEIGENQELKQRKATYFKEFCLDENVKFEVENGIGKIILFSTYRYNRANNIRSYFKSTNKKEIIDGYNKFLYYNLNYVNDRNEQDIRNIFKDAKVQVVKDDKTENEITIQYEATIEKPYFTDKQGNRFLMYFDHNILKKELIDFHHKDSSFWHNYDSERYEIELIADQNIDTKEKYTIQQLDIVNDLFSYSSKKEIKKKSGKVIIEYKPLTNKEITLKDIAFLREEYFRISDSNFGLGIDIIEKGFFNSIKRLFS